MVTLVIGLAASGCWQLMMTPTAIGERGVRFHQTVQVTVLDAETQQPVAGATVTVTYGGWEGLKPKAIAGVTDERGHIELRVVKDRAPFASAQADGYMPSVGDAGDLGTVPPPSVVLRMFRLPEPHHVLEVPDDYRGLLRFRIEPIGGLRLAPEDHPSWQPFQREFVTRLEPGQVALMHALPQMGSPYNDLDLIRAARFTSGKSVPLWLPGRATFLAEATYDELSQRATGDTIALWTVGIRSLPTEVVMFLGTLRDARVAQADLQRQWDQTEHPGLFWLPPLPQTGQ